MGCAGQAPDPRPRPPEALIAVAAFSLNYGENFNLHTPVGADLAFLIDLVTQGRLDLHIGWRGPWDRAAEAAEALLSRRLPGKAVLDLPPNARYDR